MPRTTSELQPIGAGAEDDLMMTEPDVFVPSGLQPLDALILGAVAGEVTVIAGAPSQGKTALAMQWAMTAATNGTRVAVLSMEMSRRALRNRMIAGLTGVPMNTLRMRNWRSKTQHQQVLDAASMLNELPLLVDERGGLSAETVFETVTSWRDERIGFGVVDYLQLLSGKNESRVTQVGDAIRAIKAAAREIELPVVIVSSVNRQAAMAGNRPPKLSDLRDSGDIEFVTDTAIMFHYPQEDWYEDVRECEIHVLKQRNGPTGIVPVAFHRSATRFEAIK